MESCGWWYTGLSPEAYRLLLRENDLAQSVFETVTAAIVKEMELSIKKQRLDSTHLFSNMARFGRLKLLAVWIKRFLVQLKCHDRERCQALPEELTARYGAGENRLFGAGSKQSRSNQEDIQQAARDMVELIGCFSENNEASARSSFKSLVRVFTEHCEVTEEEIAVGLPKAEDENALSARVLQNPSDPDAGYDGHKGPGFQVQLAQACDTKEPGQRSADCRQWHPVTGSHTGQRPLEPARDRRDPSPATLPCPDFVHHFPDE